MRSKITAVVVDDEMHARQALLHALKDFDQVEVIAECENGLQAVKLVQEKSIDLMFLDIHMPKLDGFDVLDLLADEMPITVFVTAYDEYAIQAFEANALDYLLKPVSRERLQKTVERVLNTSQTASEILSSKNTKLLGGNKRTMAPIQRILVRDKSDVYVIAAEDIQYIESADDYVVIHTAEKNHIKQERLQNLEDTLDPHMFCRVHRTSIINVTQLVGIETESKGCKVAVMRNKDRLSVSRSGYQRLVKLL